jgi:hypothetical protein
MMIRVVQRGPSVIRIQTRRTWSDRKIASQIGLIRCVAPKIRVHQHNCRIAPRSKLKGALRNEGGRVAMRQTKLGDPFRGDCSKKESGGRHAALAKETQLAVKPGPIAVSNVREGKPA